MLLLLGLAMYLGGCKRDDQRFNAFSAHTASVMLSLTSTSLLIPTVCQLLAQATSAKVFLQPSVALMVLILIYFRYLRPTRVTGVKNLVEESQNVPKTPSEYQNYQRAIPGQHEDGGSNNEKLPGIINAGPQIEEDDSDDPQLAFWVAIPTFPIAAVLLFLCTDYVVGSIDEFSENSGLSLPFIGVVLFPLPSFDSEAVTIAMDDKLDLTLNITVAKIIQTGLIVLPFTFTILLGRILEIRLAPLLLNGFEMVALFGYMILLNATTEPENRIWQDKQL